MPVNVAMADPMRTNPNIDTDDANRMKDRTEKVLAIWTKSNTETEDPKIQN